MRIFSSFMMLVLAAFLMLMPGVASVEAQGLALAGGGLGGSGPHMRARLEAETQTPAPGQSVTIAIVMEPDAGWHGYWENPGDAGVPMDIRWSLPDGFTVGALRYPVPHGLLVSGLMNHVYEGRYAVLADLTLPATAKPGTVVPLRAHGEWLVCSDTVCVPEKGDLSLDLTVGKQGVGNVAPPSGAFDEYRRALPRPLGGEAVFQADDKGGVRIAIPYPAGAALRDAHFFPLTEGAKSYAAQQKIAREGNRLVLTVPDFALPAGGILKGVLRIGGGQGIAINARRGVVPPVAEDAGGNNVAEGWAVGTIMLAFAGAVLGGLILNIMPCVFPILSLKAMSLLRTGTSPAHAKAEAWAYLAGVVLTCVALGGAVLALRAGGESVGWAFQLQSPAVILALLALSLAIALNLAGLFTLAPLQLDGSLSTRRGVSGDFWSGVLVAFVATPCTGPFMATALGTALLLPTVAAMAIFAGLGIGIALPFLLLAYVPALRARMPRPGAWMETVQRWLSIPMFLTALALLWLLWRQAGNMGLMTGAGVIIVLAVLLGALGRRQKGGMRRHHGFAIVAGCAAIVALGGLSVEKFSGAVEPGLSTENPHHLAYNEEALAEARGSGKPIFLYFTADWCLSCKVNEAAAINREEVRDAFDKADVQAMVGDWTKGEPAITRFLDAHGRSGVPLYLWYPSGGKEPKELPQILTPGMLTRLAEGKGA